MRNLMETLETFPFGKDDRRINFYTSIERVDSFTNIRASSVWASPCRMNSNVRLPVQISNGNSGNT